MNVPVLAAAPSFQTERSRKRAVLLYRAGVVIITAVMCARIAVICFTFTQTFDEAAHIAAGMEWLDKGVYAYESAHR